MPALVGRFFILAVMAWCGAGCSSIPFQNVVHVPVADVQPAAARDQFAQSLPRQFEVVNSLVFVYGGRSVATLGYAAVDEEKQAFTVVGLNPVGIKLFELSGTGNDVECRFAVEEFTRRGDFARAVADDIKRIFFDRIPVPEAKVYKEKYRIIFRQPTATDMLEHVFAGTDTVLIEKRYYHDDQLEWTVSYYEYQRKDGKLHPAGIILRHYRYHYQLIVRLKEIRS